MTHKSSHVINRVGPIFADPEVRETLDQQTCVKVDAIMQKDELTRKDRRCISHALDEWLMHEHDED